MNATLKKILGESFSILPLVALGYLVGSWTTSLIYETRPHIESKIEVLLDLDAKAHRDYTKFVYNFEALKSLAHVQDDSIANMLPLPEGFLDSQTRYITRRDNAYDNFLADLLVIQRSFDGDSAKAAAELRTWLKTLSVKQVDELPSEAEFVAHGDSLFTLMAQHLEKF
jgi:hypothetical protein